MPKEKIDTNVGVAVLLRREEDGLFAGFKRSDNGRIQLPAGFLQSVETDTNDAEHVCEDEQEGAARELLEETGIKVNPKDLILIYVTSTRRSPRFVFFALPPGKPFAREEPLTPEEGELVWTRDEVIRATHPANAAAFEAWEKHFSVEIYPKTA